MSLTPRLDSSEKNYLINGNFDFWQRTTSQVTVTTNRAFAADRWMLFPSVTNSNASQQIRAASGNTGATYDLNFGPWAQNKKCAVAQIVENVNTKELQGKTVTFSCYIKTTNPNVNQRIQILSWTGTADAVTGFTNAVPYTEWTNYTLASNFTSLGVLNRASSAANAYEQVSVTATVPSNCANIIIVIAYADDGGNQQFVSKAKLAVGSTVTDFSYYGKNYVEELHACQRYYQRKVQSIGVAQNANTVYFGLHIGTPMRIPVPAITATAANVSFYNGAVNTSGGNNPNNIGGLLNEDGMYIFFTITGFAGLTTGTVGMSNTGGDGNRFVLDAEI